MTYDELFVGRRLGLGRSESGGKAEAEEGQGNSVVLEITEPIIPCANLCRLPYIYHPDRSPPERTRACQNFLTILDRAPGLTGWYAKVIRPGTVRLYDTIEFITTEVVSEGG